MFAQWAKLQEQVFKAFASSESAPSPADEMADLARLVDSGAFAALEEDDRRNEACRIGRLGIGNPMLETVAVALLVKLLRDPDDIVRWDAAHGLMEIAQASESLKMDILPVLQTVKADDPDSELRAIVSVRLNKLTASPHPDPAP